mmetsp:Transcript_2644/g.7275  ORF Transcript_2644/g.7275 Transcript_2644/m.7275 type:complete len:223 (-) Transcript_2644:303-971(-)|eukprot:CAMPEP_0115845618 /NCGR_PEP_ID=MMETSP0287-20121206/9447_1 /TAXON_ID=412157 /ORGANISM="Chrysochromulina rotalis, Strain UIO044" /LENGTH=222 /DNA_ID=CAMNT_0003299401 /DNA_START=23 /DNA_END=691 /DNA_ORIENTATION=-
MQLAQLILLAGLWPTVFAAQGDNCTLTGRPAKQARYLKFCQDYNSKACCIPGHDLENQVQFENLIDGLGPGCKNPMMYPEVRYFYCLGCDPEQPKYTNAVTSEVKICKSFLDKLWRDPAYEECGVMKSNACPSNWVDENMDPYMCGDDLVLPKQEYNNDPVQFINAFKPPGLDDYTFVQVDDVADSSLECWSAPAFQSSATRVSSSITVAVMAAGFALRSLL